MLLMQFAYLRRSEVNAKFLVSNFGVIASMIADSLTSLKCFMIQ